MNVKNTKSERLSYCWALNYLPFLSFKISHGLASLVFFESVLNFWVSLLHIELKNLILVNFLLDDLLSISARELILGDKIEFVMHYCSLFTLTIKYLSSLRNLS